MTATGTKLGDIGSAIAAQLATGLALLDGAGRFCWLNPAWAETLGVSPRRLMGELLAVLDPAQPALVEALQRAQAEGGSVHVRHLRLAPPLGRALLADLAVTALPDGGALLELHELSADTEAVDAERDAPRLSESLRGFAHEVKNPLAGLRGAAQLLRRRVGDGDLVELAELVIAEADRLTALADRLLNASAKPHLTLLNIHEPIERVLSVLAAEEHAPRLQRDFDPSLPSLRGDADRLTQLLLNLARNASEAGARTLTLRTRVERGAHLHERIVRTALRVDVVDDGRGVPTELTDSLFLPLVSGRAQGTGLGLALCQEIAREHGGTLTFRSRPGDTVFTLILPLELPHG
jgi:two-component system nitrogen regulation sensor histidine kinase GlnL